MDNLVRKRWRQFTFGFLRGRYSASERLSASATAAHATWQILRAVAWSFASAVVLVAVMSGLDAVLAAHSANLHAITNWYHLDPTASASLLGSLAEIAGVFLGLYFAVVGTLASSRYADVPPPVLELILAEKVGGLYIRLTALLGTVAVLLLAMQGGGVAIGPADLLLVTLLGAATILAFLVLGRRAVQFFDPAHFVPQLGGELARLVDKATSLSTLDRRPPLQAESSGPLTTASSPRATCRKPRS